MACFHPVLAFQGEDGYVRFSELARDGSVKQLELSCGQCVGCRLERSRQWAVRCMHEAQMHEANCFITLTYKDDGLPRFMSLRYKDFQLFMKRLRKVAEPGLRFFMCGEYGGEHARPHFHACLFGHDFRDKVLFRRTQGAALYRSAVLEKLWPHGFSTIGAVTFESAAYVARYVLKKVNGDAAVMHYGSVDTETGEVVKRCPEFCRMSLGRRPGEGIGGPWLQKFWSDVFPRGKVVVNGEERNSPRYYDKRFRSLDSNSGAELDLDREMAARASFADRSDARLAVREACALARVKLLKRRI